MGTKCQCAQVWTRQVVAAEEGDKWGGRRLTRQASLLQSPKEASDVDPLQQATISALSQAQGKSRGCSLKSPWTVQRREPKDLGHAEDVESRQCPCLRRRRTSSPRQLHRTPFGLPKWSSKKSPRQGNNSRLPLTRCSIVCRCIVCFTQPLSASRSEVSFPFSTLNNAAIACHDEHFTQVTLDRDLCQVSLPKIGDE